jgi:hypothetical protein
MPLVDWENQLSTESVIFAANGTLAAFNSHRYGPISEERVSANWNGLYLWNLDSGDISRCVADGELIVPEGYSRGWITDLLGFSEDLKRIHVKVGLEIKRFPERQS